MSHSLHLPSNPTSPIPKPPRLLPRSPSDPMHLSTAAGGNQSGPGDGSSNNQPIYVLTADGSSLFLLDPSKPRGGEEPPPYASFPITPQGSGEVEQGGVIRPQEGVVTERSERSEHRHGTRHRDRARTLSELHTNNENVTRPRYHTSQSYSSTRRSRSRSALNSPYIQTSNLPDENTPLLIAPIANTEQVQRQKRGVWRSIWCGDLDTDERSGGWGKGFKRFWRPVGRREYWRAMTHLVFLNFPLALLVWPFLLAGTLAGTVLLITLPLGAAVWWLTLFISRSAARLESIMQLHYHSPISPASPPSNQPIFYRLIPRSAPSSPLASPTSPYPQTPGLENDNHHNGFSSEDNPSQDQDDPEVSSLVWEKRFMKCSYAMFLDHYSYSALSYFLLIKPLITLFSTIVIIVLLPIGFGTIIGLPIYLRILRRWGKWQAEVAIENL